MDLAGLELTWLGHAAVRLRTADGAIALLDPWLTGNPGLPRGRERTRARRRRVPHPRPRGPLRGHPPPRLLAGRRGLLHPRDRGVPEGAGRRPGHRHEQGRHRGRPGRGAGHHGRRPALGRPRHRQRACCPEASRRDGCSPSPAGPPSTTPATRCSSATWHSIRDLWAPDIAFLPIGGHYTMDPAQAARAARLLGCRDRGPHPLRHLPHPRRHAGGTGRRPRRQRHRGGRPEPGGAGRG